jgi:L-fuconolactonase
MRFDESTSRYRSNQIQTNEIDMFRSRREFLLHSAMGSAAGLAVLRGSQFGFGAQSTDLPLPKIPIIDTHQHLWWVSKSAPPWLANADEILKRDYGVPQYREATEGLDVSAVYMEVDVAPEDHVSEAENIIQLINSGESSTRAAVIGGRPSSDAFAAYVARFAQHPEVKGVRQVLHGASTPRGYCITNEFVRGMRILGEHGLNYDICMRPAELSDAAKLISSVPETRFVLDHCGNADPKAFSSNSTKPSHDPDRWRRDIESIAALPNVSCKISGIVAAAPEDWKVADLAPIINHCLDSFGPDRVIFGGDWPVCLLGSPFKNWVSALHQIIKDRTDDEQQRLWSGNAKRIYRLEA